MEPEIRFCTSADGTSIAYAVIGSGQPLVCVFSFLNDIELTWEQPLWRQWLERLAEERQVVTFDRRGVGGSQREVEDYSLGAHVEDVAAVVDDAQLPSFDLFGSADGAPVAAAYAAHHPDRVLRMVLWSSFARGTDIGRPSELQSVADLVRQNWKLARKAIADIVFPNGPTDRQRATVDMLRRVGTPEIVARGLEFQAALDVADVLPNVKAPTLVLHRRGDRSRPSRAGRDVALLIPGARFLALEGDISAEMEGHTSYLEPMMSFLGESAEPAAAAPAPGGLVTILFTDIESSTSHPAAHRRLEGPRAAAHPQHHRPGRPGGARRWRDQAHRRRHHGLVPVRLTRPRLRHRDPAGPGRAAGRDAAARVHRLERG